MLPSRIILCNTPGPVIDAWHSYFDGVAGVEIVGGDIFSIEADALVSTANSFGRMDGGLDEKIADLLGYGVQDAVLDMVEDRHEGELVVGLAEVVPTNHTRYPYLVCAPTMRMPQDVSRTVNSYLAFRAVLRAVRDYNTQNGKVIDSLLVPGLGTGNGCMPPLRAARQMRAAYDHVVYGRSPNLDISLDAGVDSMDRSQVIGREAAVPPGLT
jgi:O-acetyl-ADP-ribose deacetylase (regulator of RNase III)